MTKRPGRHRWLRRVLVPMLLAAASGTPALAGSGAGLHACRAEVEALCPDALSAAGLRRCLAEHAGELPAGCGRPLGPVSARHITIRTACAADVGSLCPAAAPGRETRECLREHRGELSVDCAEALARP